VAIFEDMLFIVRRFRHSALFLLVTLTTLAVSMGASTTMFTVVNAFLLSSLPYKDADRLAMIWNRAAEASKEIDSRLPLSPGTFSDLRENSRGFEQIASFFMEGVNVSEPNGANRAQALFVAFALGARQALTGLSQRVDGRARRHVGRVHRADGQSLWANGHSFWLDGHVHRADGHSF